MADSVPFLGLVNSYLEESKRLLDSLPSSDIAAAADLIWKALRENASVYVFGNGGSAALASHFATDVAKIAKDIGLATGVAMKRLKVFSLVSDLSLVTAFGNDYGYEQVFVSQLEGILAPRDVVVGISTSGASPNVIRALEYASKVGASTLAITGNKGKRLKETLDCAVVVPSEDTAQVENAHLILTHLICLCLGKTLMDTVARRVDQVTAYRHAAG